MSSKLYNFLTFSAIIIFSQASFAERVNIDNLKNKSDLQFHSPRLLKKDGAYYIQLLSRTYYDRNGIEITAQKSHSTKDEYYSLNKNIKIPVNITYENHQRLGGKYQGLGFGDDDERTGEFENYENLRVEDLLSRYTGTSYNAGIVLIGGGYSKAISDRQIELSEGNGSILFIGPAGMPIGVNAGFEKLDYTFYIKAPLKAAFAEYQLTGYVDRKVIARESREESVAMDEILKAELK